MERFGPRGPFDFDRTFKEAQQDARPRKLLGASVLDYAERTIDPTLNLLGDRWLSRLCGGFIVAPSGHGKSSLVTQATICWSCAKSCFAIRPPRPLRIFIAQAEDDNNDMIEMAQMIDRLELGPGQRELVRHNTHVEWLNDCTGEKFFKALGDLLTAWPADLLIINPFTAYQIKDIQDTQANNDFLRVGLGSLMRQFFLGCLIVHHTGKTQFQKKNDFAWYDWMYDMNGGAVLTNWARAVLVVAPTTTPGTYKFIAAKRFEKIGWKDREYWFSHSLQNDQMLWVPSNSDQIAGAKLKGEINSQDFLTLVPIVDPISQDKLIELAKDKLAIGRDRAKRFIKILLSDNAITQIESKRTTGRPELLYLRNNHTPG